MMSEPQPYMAYLLRLWQVNTESEPVWRAWLENSQTGEQCGFATLEGLFDYLRARIGTPLCAPSSSPSQADGTGVSRDVGSEPLNARDKG
jgi:hypothetical protein